MADLDIDALLHQLSAISEDPSGGASGVPGTTGLSKSEDDLLGGGVPWSTAPTSQGTAPPKIRVPPKGGSPTGMGIPGESIGDFDTQSVSLEDTYKSNVQGNQPAMGSTYDPLGGVSLDGIMDDPSASNLGYTTTETVQEEIPNPYAFDNFTSESTEVVEETTDKTKKLVMIAGIGILVLLVVIVGAITIGRKFNSKSNELMPPSAVNGQGNAPNNEQPNDPSQGAQYAPPPSDATPEYTGPKIQTASPESLATSSDYFDDIMSVDKQIQVENGTVECYFLGTPKFFGKPVKIPVSVEVYNASGPLDIVKIRYNVVRISGTDYIIDPIVISE